MDFEFGSLYIELREMWWRQEKDYHCLNIFSLDFTNDMEDEPDGLNAFCVSIGVLNFEIHIFWKYGKPRIWKREAS